MNSSFDFSVLRVVRKSLGLTLEQLAKKAELTYPTVASIETNKAMPSLKTLDALASALEMTTSKLLFLSEQRIIQKRKGQTVEIAGFESKQLGGTGPMVTKYGPVKIIRMKMVQNQQINGMELHDQANEFCYVLTGVVKLLLGDSEHILAENESILFDGQVPHSYQQIQTGEFVTIHMPKDSDSIDELLRAQK